MKEDEKVVGKRSTKDTVFCMLFRDRGNLLSLYNAMNGTHYTNPDFLEIVTLENAVYMSMKNDLAFLADFSLYLYEHQSTVNPNMPLRFLLYVAKEYEKLIDEGSIYGRKRLMLPEARFAVFYNGVDDLPERMELRLSESFQGRESVPPQLELRVQVWNINAGKNKELKEQCRTLKEYMQYVDCVREKARTMPVKEAVPLAVDQCISEGILSEFLRKNKAEVVPMSIYEYNEEAVMKVIREQEREYGREEGREEGIALMRRLMECLVEKNRQEEILRVANDEAYARQLLAEYGI
ncbi:MAG: hypothetical protein NC432_06040 [Roseburia sp.]|nr:hypothetical protein [Roseburia sp.]